MTLKELKEEVGLALENKPREWRIGQFVDGIDCFYRDDKIDEFLEACLKRINTTT